MIFVKKGLTWTAIAVQAENNDTLLKKMANYTKISDYTLI